MNMNQSAKPEPQVNELNREFFEGASAGELRLQRCTSCEHLRYPIAMVCPRCLSAEAKWERLSGDATVTASVVFHHVYNAAWTDEIPYNVSIVRLSEGPSMMTNVVGIAADAVAVGMPVRVTFTKRGEHSLPRFTPVSAAS